MLEKQVEEYFRKQCQKEKWMCLKLSTPSFTGVPDRLVLLPNGEVRFVELKAPGKTPRPRQLFVFNQLEKYLHKVAVLDTKQKVDEWIKSQVAYIDSYGRETEAF